MHPKDADQKRDISALHDTDPDLDVDLEAETAPDLEKSLRDGPPERSSSGMTREMRASTISTSRSPRAST